MSDIRTVFSAKAGLHYDPLPDSKLHHELLRGESFEVLEDQGEWLKARAVYDGYEGYIKTANAKQGTITPTHKLIVPRSHLYPVSDYKALPLQSAFFMSTYNIPEQNPANGFVRTHEGEWIFAKHLSPIASVEPDHVETALGFLHTPYLWGGRSAEGIDCAALIQLAVSASGIYCERDTKDQIDTLGEKIENEPLKRGDIVFFPRHVGIMTAPDKILNATSRHMSTVIEDIDALKTTYGAILGVKRLPGYCPG